MSEEKEAFLDRWSRLKTEKPAQQPAAPVPDVNEEKAVPPLPAIEDLKPDSDFTPFMNPKVDSGTRRAALKKLFSDAHYNVPDPFEAYSEDWTVGEAIPAEMLKTLNHAKKLLFDEPEKPAEAASATAVAPDQTAQADSPSDQPKDAVGKQDA